MSDPWSRYYARRGAVWSEMEKFSDFESIGQISVLTTISPL